MTYDIKSSDISVTKCAVTPGDYILVTSEGKITLNLIFGALDLHDTLTTNQNS